MMKKYDSYKDSGLEWIGEIPSGWELRKGSTIGNYSKGNGIRKDEVKETGLPCIRYGEIYTKYNHKFEQVKTFIDEGITDVKVSIGTLFMTGSGELLEEIGKCVVYVGQEELYVGGDIIILKPFREFNSEFLSYQINSECVRIQRELNGRGGIIVHIYSKNFKDMWFPTPSLSEQKEIVSFLDTKTSLIDSLIEKTKRKIELLKEGRTSLINEVVTKGLNPNVEMKDSGVEWIGEIPKGWEVKRLKYVSDVKPSNVDKHIFPDEIQVRLCNYTDVYYNNFITESTELKSGSCSQMEFEKFRLEKGDVIITKDSESPDDIGIPCLVKDDFEDVVCGYHLALIRPQTMDGGFTFRFIQSDRTRRYFEIHSNGITRYGLGKSSIENLFLPLPPLFEQKEIVSYLDEHTQLIDKTISVEQRRIELLKEYRQSLISEVVTGKIDVRVN